MASASRFICYGVVLLSLYACTSRQSLPAEAQEIAVETAKNKALADTLKETVISTIDLDNVPLHEALVAVIKLANAALPTERHIQYVIADPAPYSGETKVTLHIKNATTTEALGCLLRAQGFHYRICNGALYIYLTGCVGAESLVTTRILQVPSHFFKLDAAQSNVRQIDVKAQLQERGVDFVTNGKAYYIPQHQLLYVRNNLEQLDLIEQVLKLPSPKK